MNQIKVIGMICICLLVATAVSPQELSTEDYDSEDELYEAFLAGDIDYEQYLLLLEIARQGVDSTNAHLLEFVPNLFPVHAIDSGSKLESEQATMFKAYGSAQRSRIRYSHYRTVAVEQQFRYQLDGRIMVDRHWRTDFGLRRELTGRERLVNRSMRYKNDNGFVRSAILGSFEERYGLGAVIGYHGKLLHFSDELNRESLLYPDYGGYNGFAVAMRKNNWEMRELVSITRDSSHEVRTIAGLFERKNATVRSFAVAGFTRLRNRLTDNSYTDLKISTGAVASYSRGTFSLEYCRQINYGRSAGALLVEGRHPFQSNRVSYAIWSYGKQFIDLTSGGRAVDMRASTRLTEPDFEITSKRSGQSGMQIKGVSDLNRNTTLHSAVVVARQANASSSLQWLEGIEHEFSQRVSVRIDYLHKARGWNDLENDGDTFTRRCRAEATVTSDRLEVRSYVAFSSSSSYGDYVSLYFNMRNNMSASTHTELLSNLSRLSHGTIQYWYLYAKLTQQLTTSSSLGIKFMHRYNRTGTVPHGNAVSLELENSW